MSTDASEKTIVPAGAWSRGVMNELITLGVAEKDSLLLDAARKVPRSVALWGSVFALAWSLSAVVPSLLGFGPPLVGMASWLGVGVPMGGAVFVGGLIGRERGRDLASRARMDIPKKLGDFFLSSSLLRGRGGGVLGRESHRELSRAEADVLVQAVNRVRGEDFSRSLDLEDLMHEETLEDAFVLLRGLDSSREDDRSFVNLDPDRDRVGAAIGRTGSVAEVAEGEDLEFVFKAGDGKRGVS